MSSAGSTLRVVVIRFGIAFGLVLVLTSAAVAGAYWETNRQVDSIKEVEITGLDSGEGLPPEGGNFVIIGSDSRESGAPLNPGDEEILGSERSDTLMVAHVDPSQKTGLLVSFPRDLWVEIPDHGMSKINAAFSLGGPQLVIDTLQANFDIPITNYMEVDFAGFQGIVDAIGGVPVYFAGSARDIQTGFSQPFGPGCVPLNGEQGLAYVRSREYEVFDGESWVTDPTGDLGRIERQQDFMRRLASRALEDVGANPIKARDLAEESLSHLTVDQTLGTRDVLSFIDTFRTVDPNSDAFESITVPNEGGFEAGQSVLFVKQPEADELMARLRQFGPTPEAPAPPGIDPFTVTVEVRNGSAQQGIASATAGALSEQGFATAGAGNADNFDYAQTEVRYAPDAKDKAALVLSYLGGAGTLVEDSSITNTDVVLVVGADFVGIAPPDQVEPPAPVETPEPQPGDAPAPEEEQSPADVEC